LLQTDPIKDQSRAKYLLHELDILNARSNLLDFTRFTQPTFDASEFHKIYYHVLDLFAKGVIKKLMVTVPPQHGKSQGSTRQLPAYLFGINPNLKIAVASYNSTFARKFNRDIQRIIDTPEYHEVFPLTFLNESNVVTVSDSYLRNSEEFEIVGFKGGLKAIGRGGALTGNAVDIMVMDDLYKDYAEGNSPIVRESVIDWYTSVVKTRLHNESQELIVFTRWHEEDLIGWLEKKEKVITVESFDDLLDVEPDTWVKLNFSAIKEDKPTELDSRQKGEALWPHKHNLKKLETTRALDPEMFNCLYQGNPMSAEGLLYKPFKTWKELPELKIKKAYVDSADKGDDYLCAIAYGIPVNSEDKNIYVLDILYTQSPMEITERDTTHFLIRNNVNIADIESNNAGRSFARVVEQLTPQSVTVQTFVQSGNKESRIFSQSAQVNNCLVFPHAWSIDHAEFYDHVTRFKKMFKANKHDDAPDTMTGIIEMNQNKSFEFF
jgi:predicted phage terminase large subunit-like protein